MRSIRNQLLVYLVPGVILLTASAALGLYAYMEETLEHGLDVALAAKAEAIVGAVHLGDDGEPHLQWSDATAPAAARHAGPFYFQIRRADGRTLARVAPPTPGETPLPAPANRRKHFADARLPDGSVVRVYSVSFVARPDGDKFDALPGPSTRPAGALSLIVAHDRRSVDGPLVVLMSGLLFAAAVVIGGILLIVTWGVRRGLRPLATLSRLADQVGPASLEVRFPGGDELPPELLPIGLKLNDLLDRLQAAFERERRFSAAVAHELRTPLAELRSLCEVTLRWPESGDASRSVSDALAIAVEMGGIVENLMRLSRCEAGVDRPALEAVELSPLVHETWASCRLQAGGERFTAEVDVDSPCQVQTDPQMLLFVLRNLLANAVEYTPAGGRISLRSRIEIDAAVLTIGNTSVGLLPADLPRLSEAFWRKDEARTGSSHVGLGLAIVDVYCRVTNIRLEKTLTGDWFEIALHFPAGNGTRSPRREHTASEEG